MIHRSSCPDPETLAAYVDGLLEEDAIERVDRHIDHCADCRGELSTIASVVDSTLGRYSILRTIGRGGMGIVVRAYDQELERPVALKLLATARDEDAQRLRREAQAMARLAHPNVVRIYDVTTYDGAIVIAMELVDGTTLRSRIVDGTRDWRAMLDLCIAAGRGLAAAHAAKLIHRDFKPENVLCADDGRVLVSDFGLARSEDDPPDRGISGTPAYMAPEVAAGGVANAASDQYSFCVTVHEALYGVRPFATPRSVVPIAHGVLLRGLSSDPTKRFPSMDALLDALAASARRRWPRGSRITGETTWRNRPRTTRQARRFRH